MNGSRNIIYDSGRFPLWCRIPALAFGLGVLWLGVALAAWRVFGVSLGIPMSRVTGSPLLASLACLAISALWIFIWFAHLRVLFDATRNELVIWTRGYLRSHERVVSLAGSREFHIWRARGGLTGGSWKVRIDFVDGRSEWLVDIPSGADALADALRPATKLPVNKHDD